MFLGLTGVILGGLATTTPHLILPPPHFITRPAFKYSSTAKPKDDVDHTIVLPVHDPWSTDAKLASPGVWQISGLFYIGYKTDPGYNGNSFWVDNDVTPAREELPVMYLCNALSPSDFDPMNKTWTPFQLPPGLTITRTPNQTK